MSSSDLEALFMLRAKNPEALRASTDRWQPGLVAYVVNEGRLYTFTELAGWQPTGGN